MPFCLDKMIDLPRYVAKDTYQTSLDVEWGYDHILLMKESRTFFGIEWGGWYFVYSSLAYHLLKLGYFLGLPESFTKKG